MSNTGPTQDQVDIANALNKALEESSQLFDKVAKSAEGASQSISNALKNSAKYFENQEDLTNQYEKLNKELERNIEQQGENSDLLQKMAQKQYPTLTKANEKHIRALALMTTAYAGLNQGIEGTIGIFKLTQSVLMSGFNVLMGGLKLVGAAFQGLWKSSADYYNRIGKQVFTANQNLIEQFGAMQGPTTQMVKSFTMGAEGADILAQSGKSLYTVIGDVAERIAEMGKIGAAFGELLVRLGHHASEAASSMMILEKGMGITYETMKTMAANAEASGGTLQEQLDAVAIASAHMADKFGIDVKQIGKGFDQMAKDVLHFGDIAPEALAATAAYAVKLGVEVKNLAGIMDQFDSFESAAQSAGMLAEAFGMNIDAMDMMMSDNPAERIDQLRRAFQDTGKSVSDLSRHELKLLQQQMGGMDIESMKNALSMPVDEMGFDDFSDAMEEAGEKISLEDSLVKIADSIKLLEHAFVELGNGPFASFIAGFEHIIDLNGTWREAQAVNADFLKKFQEFGMSIANSLASWVGSAEDARAAFEAFYNFEGLDKMLTELKDGFDDFLDMLKTDPGKAGREFMQLIIDSATEYLSGVGGGQLSGGFGNVIEQIITAVGTAAPLLIDKVASVLHDVAAYIRGDGIETMFGDSMQGGMLATLGQTISSVFNSLVDVLLPALMDMFGALFDKIKPYLYTALAVMWTAVLIKSIVTALIQQAVISIAVGKFKNFIGDVNDGLEEAGGTGGGGGTSAAQQTTATIVDSLGSVVDRAAELEPANIQKAGKNLTLSAVSFLPAMIGYALAAIAIAKVYQASGVGLDDTLGAFMSIGASLGGLLLASKIADKIDSGKMGKVMEGLIAAAVVLTVGGAMYIGALWLLTKIWVSTGVNSTIVEQMFDAIGLSMYAVIGMSLVGAALGLAIGGPQGVAIGVGILAAGVLLGITGAIYLYSLKELQGMWTTSGLSPDKINDMLGSIGVSMMAVLGMTFVGAVLGNPVGLVAMVFATAGVLASAAFLLGPTQLFIGAMAKVAEWRLDTDAINEIMASVGLAMFVIAGTIYAFGNMKVSTLVKGAVAGGLVIYAMASFIDKIAEPITEIMSAFGTIKVDGDMNIIKDTMDVISKILDAAQSLGALALDGAKLAIAGTLFGDSSIEAIFAQMNGFITGIMGNITGVISGIVTIAQGVAKEDLPKVSAVADIIGAVANLIGQLTEPLMKIQEQSGLLSNVLGPSLTDRTDQLMTGMNGFLSALVGKEGEESVIKRIVDSVITATSGIQNPKALKEKAEAMKGLFDGLNSIITVVGKMMEQADEQGGFLDKLGLGDDQGAIMQKTFVTIGTMFEGTAFRGMVDNITKAISSIEMPEGIVPKFESIQTVLKGTMDEIQKFGDWLLNDDAISKVYSITNYLTNDAMIKPSNAIAAIADEAIAIATALKDMDIKLDKVKLEPQLQGIMSVSGEQEITVKPGAVNMHVHFNVTMDAEELAVTMHQGNDKTNNKGFFVLTEEAKKSEIFDPS